MEDVVGDSPFQLPPFLENGVQTTGWYYVGKVYALHFYGPSLRGKAMLSKYREPDDSANPIFTVVTPRTAYFVRNGKPVAGRHTGYRSVLVGECANRGAFIEEKLLEAVFHPLERKLMELYQQIFPQEQNTQRIEGIVEAVNPPDEVERPFTNMTLYRITSGGGTMHRLALTVPLRNIAPEDQLAVGDRVRVEFSTDDVAGITVENGAIKLPDRSMIVSTTVLEWYQITSYTIVR